MVKAANPWLRGLLRAGKKQQRSVARALTVLLAPPKPAPKPKPQPKLKSKPKTAVKPPPAVLRPLAAPGAPKPAASVARLALPAPPPAPGKWLAAHYSGQPGGAMPARRMPYWLYLPDTPPPPLGWPLLVMLHGCEQSATLFAQGTRMNQVAEEAGFAVVYPQQSVSVHPHRCWKWYDRATQQGGGDVPLIVGIVHATLERQRIDPSRVYICGMSAGAGMAHIVALNHPQLFAAVGLHSGPLYGAGHSTVGALAVMRHGASARVDSAIAEAQARLAAPASMPTMPTMLIGGEADDVVRPVNQVQLRRQAMLVNALPGAAAVKVALKAGNKRSHPYQLHDVSVGRKLMLRVVQIAELKHAWSGGDPSLSYNSGAGPDASRMLVAFFARHRRIQPRRRA